MKIGVDMHVLEGVFQGSRTYITKLYSEYLKLYPENEVFCCFNNPSMSNPFGDLVVPLAYRSPNKFLRLGFDIPFICKKNNLDFFHTQYITPLYDVCPSVVTIHDILFETHPQFFDKSFVARSKIFVRRSAKRAKLILTVSEYSKKCLIDLYNVDPSKVVVTCNAVDFNDYNEDVTGNSSEILSKLCGPDKFMLAVGRLEPRKNYRGLIRAYAQLLNDKIDLPKLIIVGQRDFGWEGIFSDISFFNLFGRVVILDDVNDDHLRLLYKNALFFVYPSFAEGFGIPPLEAMAAGCPVITSNTTSLSEVVGDAGLNIDPYDVKSIASAIESLVSNDALRSALIAKGLDRSKKYSWEESAKSLNYALNSIF